MSIFYNITFICDNCGEEYLISGEFLSLPPHWINFQPIISDKNGLITEKEELSPILHFCCQECLTEYTSSEEFLERTLLVDDPDSDNEGGDPSPGRNDDE